VPEDPVSVVREVFAAVNDGDYTRAGSHLADEVVLVVEEGFLNTGTFVGIDAASKWFMDWFRAFGSDAHYELEEVRELRPGVVFLANAYGGSGRSSGATVGDRRFLLYLVEDGKVTRIQFFLTAERATQAAALPEWSPGA
jgi:ketosteroid isomerase-like protein